MLFFRKKSHFIVQNLLFYLMIWSIESSASITIPEDITKELSQFDLKTINTSTIIPSDFIMRIHSLCDFKKQEEAGILSIAETTDDLVRKAIFLSEKNINADVLMKSNLIKSHLSFVARKYFSIKNMKILLEVDADFMWIERFHLCHLNVINSLKCSFNRLL